MATWYRYGSGRWYRSLASAQIAAQRRKPPRQPLAPRMLPAPGGRFVLVAVHAYCPACQTFQPEVWQFFADAKPLSPKVLCCDACANRKGIL